MGHRRCSCELVSHGKLGPVGDNERLARVAMHPTHFNKKGQVRPGVFPISHLMHTGLSLTRVDKIDSAELVAVIGDIVRTAAAESADEVLVGLAEAIRSLLDKEGERCLCVKDDPVLDQPDLRDNEAHAIVARSANQEEPEIRALRDALLTIFGSPKKTADIYS